MQGNPYQAYQNTQVQTASQGKLIIMLFDGAIKFSRVALQSLGEKKLELVSYNLGRAQEIVNELRVTLNMEAGEVSQNLYQLYDYIYRRLIQANIKKDGEMIEEVLDMLTQLRETWMEVAKMVNKAQGATKAVGEGFEA